MKGIDHDYWTGKHAVEADITNPDLRKAMQEMYGRKGFDFGKVGYSFYEKEEKNHYIPDGYSSYTSLTGNYQSKMKPFRNEAVEDNKELAKRCYSLAVTIAGELFFPAHKLDGITINVARSHSPINDMVYPVMESIKKYYEKEPRGYPLKSAIERYGYFFDSFGSFDEYLDYNFLQDYVLLPKKVPTNKYELIEFWKKSIDFLEARSKRIEDYARRNNLFDS